VTFSYSNAGTHVSTAFTLDDDYNGVPPGWLYFTLRFGGGGPAGAAWGDYVRNRPNYPQGKMWVSSGHTVQPGGVEPRYYVVGRERDQFSYWRYLWSVWLGT
jgi:hypothetical protein